MALMKTQELLMLIAHGLLVSNFLFVVHSSHHLSLSQASRTTNVYERGPPEKGSAKGAARTLMCCIDAWGEEEK